MAGALQLLPQNASRITRLEALAHCIASLSPGSAPHISSGKIRQICIHPTLQSLMYAEDPAENQFAEEFTFFGGSYLVLPGIVHSGTYTLKNLCKAIFLSPEEALPRRFRSRAFRIIFSALNVLNEVARKAGIRRGTAPASNLSEDIVIPNAATLNILKRAAVFSATEVALLLEGLRLPSDALEPLIARAGDIDLNNYDVVNGPLLWKPFVKCGDRIILAIPGMVVSAIRHAVLVLAIDSDLHASVAELYSAAVWEDVKESLSFTRNIPLHHQLSGPLGMASAAEGLFSLDHDKVLYCLTVTDPLAARVRDDPFGIWTSDALEASVNQRLSGVEQQILTSNPAPNEVFIVVAFQGLGGFAAFGLKDMAGNSQAIPLSADALRTISLLEGGDPLALFNFTRKRDRISKTVQLTSTNVLDEFYLYRKNESSFYFSDRKRPDVITIPPGDCLGLVMEIAQQRDFHGAITPERATVEVTSLHSSTAIPIYSPVADLGNRVRLLVEGFPVPIWVSGPADGADEDHRHYALFADAISYWIWQFTAFLAPFLESRGTHVPIDLKLKVPPAEAWAILPSEPREQDGILVQTKVDSSSRSIEISISAALIPLLRTADNRGERELMRSILGAFASLVNSSQQPMLDGREIEAALDRIAPLGMKKMLLLFDSSRAVEIDEIGLPPYRALQNAWTSEQLDRIGEFLVADGLAIGEVPSAQRTNILNRVAFYCFSQMEKIIATLSSRDLLPFLIAYSESVHREQILNRLTIPTKLECFHSIPQMIDQLVKSIPEVAHTGLASRLLIEYVVAQPPNGIRPISLDLYDELRGWAYHSLNYAMLSDAIRFGIEEYRVSLLPSVRLGINGNAWQSAMKSHMRAFALDQIGAAPEHFKRHWQPEADDVEQQRLRTELNAATQVEFGIPLTELIELMETAVSIEQTSGAASLERTIFIQRVAESTGRSPDRLERALSLLSLAARPTFWTPPDGYVRQDLYPWRYNRPLSYMRRPFLLKVENGRTEILWGKRHLRVAHRFLVHQCMSGKLKAKSQEMRSFMNGLRDAQGEVFNKKVADFFRGPGDLNVKERVRKIGALRELHDHLGDIDVLVGDAKRKRLLIVECKDLTVARTPYEMANEATELFVGRNGKKSIVAKHQARTAWVKSHLNEVLAFLKLDERLRWRIIPLLIVDEPLVASYLRESPIEVLSFEELKRFWPELRHV